MDFELFPFFNALQDVTDFALRHTKHISDRADFLKTAGYEAAALVTSTVPERELDIEGKSEPLCSPSTKTSFLHMIREIDGSSSSSGEATSEATSFGSGTPNLISVFERLRKDIEETSKRRISRPKRSQKTCSSRGTLTHNLVADESG